MPNQQAQNSAPKTELSILINSSFVGLWRGLIGLPFQHPFDCIKTNMQAFQTKFLQTFRKTYQSEGVKGFYSGFSVNSLRVASKQIYRWPLQISLLGFLNETFGNKISRTTSGILCGVGLAAIQVVIICPFQRIKVWLMTAHKKSKGIRQFFHTFTFRNLFDGFYPVLWKQMISWVTFLGATEYLKQVAYWYSNKDRLNEDLSLIQFGFVSLGVAFINTLFVMPADCVKTQYQSFKTLENGPSKSISVIQVTKKIYQTYGLKGLFKGWESKLIQYNINSFFTVAVFEALLKEYQSLNSKAKMAV